VALFFNKILLKNSYSKFKHLFKFLQKSYSSIQFRRRNQPRLRARLRRPCPA